jgi:hypothetical protein
VKVAYIRQDMMEFDHHIIAAAALVYSSAQDDEQMIVVEDILDKFPIKMQDVVPVHTAVRRLCLDFD